jgi:hypothetical protein
LHRLSFRPLGLRLFHFLKPLSQAGEFAELRKLFVNKGNSLRLSLSQDKHIPGSRNGKR